MSTPSGKKRKLGKDGTSISNTPIYKTPKNLNSKTPHTSDSKRRTRSEQKELETRKLRNGKQISPHPNGVVNVMFGSHSTFNQCNIGNNVRVSDSPIEDDDLDSPSEDDDSDSSFDEDDPDGRKKASQEQKAKQQQQVQQRKAEEEQRKAEEKQRKAEEKQRKAEEKQREAEEKQRFNSQ